MDRNKKSWAQLGYYLPLVVLIVFYLIKSLSFPLHDFSNSYFPAKLATSTIAPETVLFDIFTFNDYAWGLGYKEVLIDFYLNSPFTLTAFLPFALINDAYIAKMLFNIFSVILFLYATFLLVKSTDKSSNSFLFILLIPVLFFTPIKNQILFGQLYFLVFSLIIFFLHYLKKNKQILSVSFLSMAALIKIFPLFYGVILIINNRWKTIFWGAGISLLLFGISIPIAGWAIWQTYLFEVIPNALANNSTVNFQYNAQSIDVFLKTILVHDSYYNPSALFHSLPAYIILKWLIKSAILGLAVAISMANKENTFKLVSIWVITLFLIQSRTATYAQIFWIIPSYYVYASQRSKGFKIAFFLTLFLMANMPLRLLENLPVFFKFSRLWLTLVLASIFYASLTKKKHRNSIAKAILAMGIILAPLHIKSLLSPNISVGQYVLEKEYFMIHDFRVMNGMLNYSALGRNGNENIQTNIPISSFDSASCTITNHQIFLNGKQITKNAALKKKPILVNQNEIYYLSDFNSRRGAYTLKKINLPTRNE